MNLYAYCGNSPLNFVDPSGLIRIAFYDPTYEVYDANGNFAETSQMEAWADDSYFTLHIPMLSSQDVLDALKGLSLKYNITEVFFFDHSVGTGDPNQYGRLDGLQFGDETLWFDDGTMEKFFTDMRDILGTGVTYHSRHCDLGMDINADRLMSLAMWSEGTVTGANGHIWSRIFPRADGSWPDSVIMNPITGAIVDLPDYDPHTGYTQVTRAKNGTYVRSPYSQPVNRFWGRPELTY
jgi:hypothetical protein